MNKLKLTDIIEEGKYKDKKISELIGNKKSIFELLKEGYILDDEVLIQSHIKKNVRDMTTYQEVVKHEKDTKVYPNETANIAKILKDLETIEKQSQFYEESNSTVLKDMCGQ